MATVKTATTTAETAIVKTAKNHNGDIHSEQANGDGHNFDK